MVGYAFSPNNLIPDPIPILGYLDDLVLLPLGIFLALKMIPPAVMAECREQSRQRMNLGKPANWLAAGVIVAIWLSLITLVVIWLVRFFSLFGMSL